MNPKLQQISRELGINPKLVLEPYNDDFGPHDPARIDELEKLLGKPLPGDYRKFLLHLAPCLFVGAAFRPLEPTTWEDPDTGLCSFDVFQGLEEEGAGDLLQDYRSDRKELPKGMFAIGYDSGANNILMCLNDPAGQIFFHDRGEDKLYLCANSFTEFLQSFEEDDY